MIKAPDTMNIQAHLKIVIVNLLSNNLILWEQTFLSPDFF